MARTLPVVYSKKLWQTATLQGWVGDRSRELIEIKLESEAWFAWLEAKQSFRFSYWQASGESVNVTVRPEKRGKRTYWQGWKTIQGQTIKKYIGPSAKMTKARLDVVGEWFSQQVKEKSEADQEMTLYAAVVDLTWLVEQLISQCQNSVLVERAQAELARIKQSVGN
jgi:hypothetical protein